MTDELARARSARNELEVTAPETSGAAPADSSLPPEASAPVTALLAMVACISDFGVAELERLTAALLAVPAPTPAEQRVFELWHLSQLLESELAVSYPYDRIAPVQVSREDYDRTRPPEAPSSKQLTERYGTARSAGWAWACRAAWGLLPDGRKSKPGMGWPSAMRGRSRKARSTRNHVVRSIRQCSEELLRRPSSNVYIEWHNAWRRRNDRIGGNHTTDRESEPATIAAIYQQFPNGWSSALAAADITDRDLEAARTHFLAGRTFDAQPGAAAAAVSPADRLAGLDGDQLAAAGLDDAARGRLARDGLGTLALGDATRLAQVLDGSLSWLAGLDTEAGTAPGAVVLDADGLRAAAKRRGVRLDGLRHGAGMDVGSWRAVVGGRREPTIKQLTGWASTLGTSVEDLTRVDG